MALALFLAIPARADEIKVMTSGAFTEAYQQLVQQFQKATHHTVVTTFGASMGGAQDSIPVRLGRGEPVDVVIVIESAFEPLIKAGHIVPGSRVQLARSVIGIAVRKGAPKPDISSVAALRQALLQAKSIAYSASASGTYVSTELFARLGVADQVKGKAKRIESERVGAVVARGDAEIGFQQVSELLPIDGIDYVGPLPSEVQQVSVVTAAIADESRPRPQLPKPSSTFSPRLLPRPRFTRPGSIPSRHWRQRGNHKAASPVGSPWHNRGVALRRAEALRGPGATTENAGQY